MLTLYGEIKQQVATLGERRRTFYFGYCTKSEKYFVQFSANVRQCNIAYCVVRVKLCFKSFCLLLCCSLAGIKKAYLCFQLVCAKPKITNAHPLLASMLKSILRTLETEILKAFTNIQPQPKSCQICSELAGQSIQRESI